MPQISDQRSVAANATVANIVQGSRFEFPPADTITSIRGGIVGSAAGLTASFSVGERIIVENYIVPVEAALGVVSRDRDYNWVGAAKPSERIVVGVTNTTAGALTETLLLELF